jgi:hypothetical protein
MVYTTGLDRELQKASFFKSPFLTSPRYYNGSTTIEIQPFSGIAAQEQGTSDATWCPNLKGKTFDIKHGTILALTERSKYNLGNNPLSAFLTLWDLGFNFSSLNASEQIKDMPWDWALFSSL